MGYARWHAGREREPLSVLERGIWRLATMVSDRSVSNPTPQGLRHEASRFPVASSDEWSLVESGLQAVRVDGRDGALCSSGPRRDELR